MSIPNKTFPPPCMESIEATKFQDLTEIYDVWWKRMKELHPDMPTDPSSVALMEKIGFSAFCTGVDCGAKCHPIMVVKLFAQVQSKIAQYNS